MGNFRIIALTPLGLADPSIAIAASRAGGLGVLDLEYIRDQKVARFAISKLARYARNDCGIKLDSSAEDFFIRITSGLPQPIKVVILTAGELNRLPQQIQILRQLNLTILLQATNLEEARLGEELGVDGLIAKGHEAGGWVGEETTFVLLQHLLGSVSLPVWAHGGIGLHTVAACYAAGVAGVVLDSQFALMRESHLPDTVKASIARMDGSETICLGSELGMGCRMYSRVGFHAVEELRRSVETLQQDSHPPLEVKAIWRQSVRDRVGWGSPEEHVWLLGQEAAFAGPLAKRFGTVGATLEGMRQAIEDHIRCALALRPLDEGSPLARSHGTRYPIVQGPMTRVSDRAEFALGVAEGGGLPFLALALMRASEVKTLLEETRRLMGERPWGVGILGFVPLDLRQEQLEVIKAYHPPFALIAGGRPDQALILEQQGIPTYLHVPSPGLLKMFLESGARRFVFEGRECGGHVGPRSSFILWDTMIDVLLESLSENEIANCHVVFAGGIHDDLSASMVATLAAPLAKLGARIGVLLGTAYIFTEQAVKTGAIVEGFQQEAIQCTQTVLLETGPGHSTRCVGTSYAEVFQREKRQLSKEGRSAEEIRNALEELNLGRLRIASKGIAHNPQHEHDPASLRFLAFSDTEQRLQGMYMIGQVAALRDRTCTIEELHRQVSVQGSERLGELAEPAPARLLAPRKEHPCNIAIIGMACLLPKAPNLRVYWENILNKVDAITEVPEDRWDWRLYFDQDPKARDKVYSKWGGFLNDMPFDPMQYGMPPNTLPSIEPLQLLTLEVVRQALGDAGYANRPFAREYTSVILGVGGGAGDLGQQYAIRSGLPLLLENPSPEVWERLPEWTEDSFAGILLNVAAGRVANRFDLGGVNYTVDAACASSLAAVYLATRELEAGTSDMVIVGGADTVQNPFAYLCFSKTRALSPRGRCRTFDESADGIVISEGVAVLVLKRLADAERDGDRIYAVIKAVAGSSDGRDKGLTAPRPEGQVRALDRAYAKAGFSPATVGLIEAHGTGTVAGDQAEVESLSRVFNAARALRQSCAVGSVKSMIGHTKCAAAAASLMKVALALHHKVLPPTINVEKPNPILAGSPFYVNTEPRPWIHVDADHPRRAGVSSFGFGGTNFHAVLEEYTGEFLEAGQEASLQNWPGELMLWAGSSRQELLESIESLQQALARGAMPALRDLSYTLWKVAKERTLGNGLSLLRLAVVTTSLEDLRKKLAFADENLSGGQASIEDHRGIYYTENPLFYEGKIAFLFPGQGSQYVDMLRELAGYFPEVRQRFEIADRTLAHLLPRHLSTHIFPPPRFNQEEERGCQQSLTNTTIAQPALGAADLGLFHLLRALGIKPEMVAGHSYGEYVALCAAGVFSEEVLYTLSESRGRFIVESGGQDLGTMAAVSEGRERVAEVLKSVEGIWIANVNAPRQTIVSGTGRGVEEAIKRLETYGIEARPIPVACAFHSPLIAQARDRLAELVSTLELATPEIEIFSNTTAAPYPLDPQGIVTMLADHLVQPVNFLGQVEAMHQAGARIFVEVGPRNVLTGLTQQILAERRHLSAASDIAGRSGLIQLLHLLGQLAAHGVPVQLERLYQGRMATKLNLTALEEETREKPLATTTWLVNGSRARPLLPNINIDSRKMALTSREKETVPDGDDGRVQATQLKTQVAPNMASSSGKRSAQISPSPLAETKPSSTIGVAVSTTSRPSVNPDNEMGQVMMQYQRLMNRFLETQKEIMLAYLQGTSETASSLQRPTRLTAQPEELTVRSNQEATPPVTESVAEIQTVLDEPPKPEPVPEQRLQSSTEKEQLTRQLVQIVSERTGYPPEMLDLDLNIEADLGIDSIKRVEIIGAFQRACFPSSQQKRQEAMEKLTGIKTLRGIIDLVHDSLQNLSELSSEDTPSEQAETAAAQPSNRTDSEVKVPRFLLTVVNAPLSATQTASAFTDGLFLITDDERGAAQAMVGELRRRGGRAVLVRMDNGFAETSADVYTTNLIDPVSVAELTERVRRRLGPITGLIHLLPLKGGMKFEEMDLTEWRRRLFVEVKSLFYLAKALAADLKGSGEGRGGWLVAATAMGGAFASDVEQHPHFFPGQGGVSGLIKTLAVEWPGARCKVVDLNPETPASTLADCLLQEMAGQDKEVEVGYRGSQRLVLRPTLARLNHDSPSSLAIDASSVVLVTGGARGITAEVATQLANRYQPTLLIVGRSPQPEPEEPPETVGLTLPRELKTVLIDRMRRLGQEATPVQVEVAYSQLLHDREIRRNLTVMRQAGAKVHYHQVDVRDELSFGNFIDEVYRSHGRLDGVIHGAGIIEDKLLEDKSPDSFDRVFDTKADSAFILSRKLNPDTTKFLVLFSSVAGRFGNRGQSDYAAANELLNKLAVYLDKQWPGRLVAINWGPWMRTGMVSADVQRQFAERGVQLIPPRIGCQMFDGELRSGGKGQVEVIVGNGPWESVEAIQPSFTSLVFPLLNGVSQRVGKGGGFEITLPLNPARDRYLQDHRLDGNPVFPAAMAVELMAEVAQRGWPDWKVVGIRSLRVLRGIVMGGSIQEILVTARPQSDPSHESMLLEIDMEIATLEQPSNACYRASVQLAESFPAPPPYNPRRLTDLCPFPAAVEEAYRRWLFHGPSFQGISTIEGLNERGISALLIPSSPSQCLFGNAGGPWLVDPVLLDCGFQLAILWERAHHDMTPLPSRFTSYRLFGSPPSLDVRCYLEAKSSSEGHCLLADIYFLDESGKVIGLMEEMEFACSKTLNRLAGLAVIGREDS